MRLRIGHLEYDVRLFRADEPCDDRWGDCLPDTQEIRLAPATPERQLATLIHELVHAAWDASGRRREKLNEEQVASFIGPALAALIINNPHLLPVLTALAGGATFQQENSDG